MPRRSKRNAELVKQVIAMVEQIRPIMTGNTPEVQGAVLAELTVTFMLGHAPEIRTQIFAAHMRAILLMMQTYPDLWEEAQKKH